MVRAVLLGLGLIRLNSMRMRSLNRALFGRLCTGDGLDVFGAGMIGLVDLGLLVSSGVLVRMLVARFEHEAWC